MKFLVPAPGTPLDAAEGVARHIMAHPMMCWDKPVEQSLAFLEAIVSSCQLAIKNLKDQEQGG